MGTYSPGKLSVVYEINIQVLPTVPSPTTTHFIGLPDDIWKWEQFQSFVSKWNLNAKTHFGDDLLENHSFGIC